jgi:hypothetical protein
MTRNILLLFLLLSACAERDPDGPRDAGPVDASPSDGGSGPLDAGLATSDCATGLRYYSLEPVQPLPAVEALELPGLIEGAQVIAAGDGAEHSARLEVCEDGGRPTLRALLHRAFSFETPTLYRWDDTLLAPTDSVVQLEEGLVIERRFPPSSAQVEGLAAALAGDPRDLRIRIPGEYGLLLRGHDGFVALAQGNVDAAGIVYSSINIVVGRLAPGDVFARLPCPFGESTLRTSFALGSATFDVEACTFAGGGETLGYRIASLAVTDTSPALAPPERATFRFDDEASVEAVMTYAWHHHNGCDSFHLALPHADYAATASPIAGCGAPVPNAPARDPSTPGDVLFRVRHRGGAWTEGAIDGCHHFLFCAAR